MDYLYSLYDALVSIRVPNDKARAVVDAMEHDMGTTLATKADLQNLGLATKADLQNLRAELHQECALIRKEMELMAANLSMSLTVRMGSMLVVVTGLLFAALRLT